MSFLANNMIFIIWAVGILAFVAAAGLVFALNFRVRQSVALFIGPINTATGIGIASISLAFACTQLRHLSGESKRG